MKKFFAKFFKAIQIILVSAILIAALLVSITGLFTPALNEHLPDMEKYVSELLHTPVSIQKVKISWSGYEPELAFTKVIALDQKTRQAKLEVESIKINFNLFRSLLHWTPLPEEIKMNGVHLTFHQTQPGQFHIEGFNEFVITDNITGQAVPENDIVKWIFSMPGLRLENIHIQFLPLKGAEKNITVAQLILKNNGQHHRLKGSVTLNEEKETHLQADLDWTGHVTDLPHAVAHLYLQIEDVSLFEWLHEKEFYHLQIKKGEGSAKIWADWSNNQWQKIQSHFQFYNVGIFSSITQKSQIFTRLSGNFGWKRDGNKQVFGGDDIFIDMSHHLWPITQFSIETTSDQNNEWQITKANTNYLDLHDIKVLAVASGLLSPELQKNILELNPSGEVHSLHFASTGTPLTAANISLAASFYHLSFNAYKNFPAVGNLTGVVDWSNSRGSLQMNSRDMTLMMDHIFANGLQFKELNAGIHLQKETNGTWQIEMKNARASNEDVKAHGDMTLTIPVNESPMINLTGDFTLLNVAHVSNYLPLKFYEPGLVTWLREAFLKGRVESGEAVIKGRLNDFPFENNQAGTFLITGKIKEVDLQYAPGWPTLTSANGDITFANTSMTVHIASGKILDVPLSSAKGVIPYLGSRAPAVLTVDGLIDTPFENAERFLHESPLKKTIGKTLAGMELKGPMQLKLNLVVPLKTAEEIKVLGDVTMPNATLLLPQWNLQLTQLKGAFRFTEKSVEGNHLQGQLFNEPIAIQLSTKELNPTSHFVQADIQGQMNIQTISDWLKIPLTKAINGQTAFAGELHLYSGEENKPTQFVLRSDLRGITIDVPSIFNKTPEQTTNFQLGIESDPTHPLQTKINFTFGEANFLSQNWKNLRVQVSKSNHDWNFELNAANVNGQVIVDSDFHHLQGKFQRIYFDPIGNNEKTEEHIDPKTLPAISFSANDVHYGNSSLGSVTLETSPTNNGLAIKNISLASSLFNVQAAGDWQIVNNNYNSHLQGKITTSKVSDLLKAWDFNTSNLVANEGEFNFSLSWPDAPYALKASLMSGTFSLKLGKGRVINLSQSTNAKMGLVSLLNILSLQTLPRRLTGDFSDLSQQGYSFDYMQGDFQLKNGNAHTQNTKLNGPNAGIEIFGRIGMQAKDYDLRVNVTPYMTSSLPLVATIAGGPIAGVATWVVDKIVTGQMVAKINTYQYSVTGPWNNPLWRELNVQSQTVLPVRNNHP